MTSLIKSAGRQLKKVKVVSGSDQPPVKRATLKTEIEDEEILNSDTSKWFPDKWNVQLDNIRSMREKQDAAVDIMGCAECCDHMAEKKVQRFQILLSLLLSSQTKDQVTSAAMNRLMQTGCTVQNIMQLDTQHIGSIITPVGFWRRKAEYIKKTACILHEKYDDDIPHSIKDLCALPGIGPKMAYLTMQTAWGENVGIGVDTHVHRISNRLGWVKKTTNDPESTRKELEDWMPKEVWMEVNKLLVGFGQQICLPLKPKCPSCLNQHICPFSVKK